MGVNIPHAERAHSRFPPSAASRWLACPGSIPASENIPEAPPSSFALDGTAAHEIASALLMGQRVPLPDDREMAGIVRAYVDYCQKLWITVRAKFPKARQWIEERCHAPNVHPELFGTADYVVHASRTLEIVDLKTGYHAVEVEGNHQLLCYAVLVLSQNQLWLEVDTVRLTIVQPKCFDGPRTWAVPIDFVHEFANTLTDATRAIDAGEVERHPGEHCKWCPVKGRCPEFRDLAVQKAQVAFADGAIVPRLYTVEELSEIAREAELIRAHLDGVLQQIRRELERGRAVPGWKLVPKRAVSRWTDFDSFLWNVPPEVMDDLIVRKPVTPNQAKDVLKQHGVEADVDAYSVRESSGPTLAPDTDKRPPAALPFAFPEDASCPS